MERIVVGISGASGTILAHKLILALTQSSFAVDLVISKAALMTAKVEMGVRFATLHGFLNSFEDKSLITHHALHNFEASIASGSYETKAMVIIPCSMGTLAAVATGLSDNLLRRAADVTLKERRTLIMVPRETPLSTIHLQHMLSLTNMGAILVPPMPAWYTHPKSLSEVENFVVGKVLDLLKIPHKLYSRWPNGGVDVRALQSVH